MTTTTTAGETLCDNTKPRRRGLGRNKSRPSILARLDLAIHKHTQKCRDEGREVAFDDDSMRRIIQEQSSGSKTTQVRQQALWRRRSPDPLTENDPLQSVLPRRTGGPIAASAAESSDPETLAVRMWSQMQLEPILVELFKLQTSFGRVPEPDDLASISRQRLDELCAPAPNPPVLAFPPAKPLW